MTLSAVIPASRQRGSILLASPFSLLTFHFFSPACRVTATDGLTRPTPRLTHSAPRITVLSPSLPRSKIPPSFPFVKGGTRIRCLPHASRLTIHFSALLTPSASRLTLNPLHDSRLLTRDARCPLSGITLSAVILAGSQRGSILLAFPFSLLTSLVLPVGLRPQTA